MRSFLWETLEFKENLVAQSLFSSTCKAKPVGVYRPPGARGSGASGFMVKTQIYIKKELLSTLFPPQQSLLLSSPHHPLRKNREQLDAEKAASIASGGNGSASSPYKASGGNNRSRGIPGSKPTTPSAASTPVPPPAAATTPASSDPEKKIKNIKKKLKQISDIKAKIDKGEAVELTQKQKLETEEALLKELKELEI